MWSRFRILQVLLIFVAIYAIVSLHSVASRDPTSVFFNPRTGYAPTYSSLRAQQAESFVLGATNHSQRVETAPRDRQLCIGIPSISRNGAQYLPTTVGSLLEGLTPEERSQIWLAVFIPHANPTVHTAYNEQWLPDLADEVLTYDVDAIQLERIKSMEWEGGMYREKGLYDYAYLVRACYKRETPYIAIFEDDVVAMDGWFHRTLAAIKEAERLSALKKARPDFLYLRLFYTEEYLGWNAEYWATYLFWSIGFTLAMLLGVGVLRGAVPVVKRTVPEIRKAFAITVAVSAVMVLMFFAFGRITVRPLPEGVNYMPKFGCCSQGFVYPRQKAMSLVHYLEEQRYGFVDSLAEEYADQYDELRWAITPPVIQHIGRKSSKVDDYGPNAKHGLSVAETIWSFAYETLRPEKLRREHEEAAQRAGGKS